LFFTIDERAQESDLSEIGREFLNPDDPDAFVLPDLMTAFAEIDIRTDLSDAAKEQAKSGLQAACDNRRSAFTIFLSSCGPTVFLRKTSSMSSRTTRS